MIESIDIYKEYNKWRYGDPYNHLDNHRYVYHDGWIKTYKFDLHKPILLKSARKDGEHRDFPLYLYLSKEKRKN